MTSANTGVQRDAWALRETRPTGAPAAWQPSTTTDALFTLANGSLGVRGTLDEGVNDGGATLPPATYLNGTYDESPIRFPHDEFSVTSALSKCDMFRVPDTSCVFTSLNNDPPLSLAPQCAAEIMSHTRTFDLKTAKVERVTKWKAPAPPNHVLPALGLSTLETGGERVLRIHSTRVVSLATPEPRVAMRYTVTSEGYAGTVTIACCNTAPSTPYVSPSHGSHRQPFAAAAAVFQRSDDGALKPMRGSFAGMQSAQETRSPTFDATYSDRVEAQLAPGMTLVTVQAPGSRADVACAVVSTCKLVSGDNRFERVIEPDDERDVDGRGTRTIFRASLQPHDSLIIERFTAYASSLDLTLSGEDVTGYAIRAARKLHADGWNRYVSEHEAAVNAVWRTSDMVIDGDEAMQGAMRYNIIQLVMNTGRKPRTAIGMKGITGDLLSGHYSWDGEVFVLPCLVWTQPALARSILQFRIDTLEAAKGRVRDLLLPRGALYPWRTIDGSESHAATACTMQLHINADIAYGFQQYLAATGDFDLFLNGGADVVLASALVWLHWGTWERGKFHLRYVTGPDEYNVLVNDNCFSNLMAANHLRFSVQLSHLIASKSQAMWEDICARIELDPNRDIPEMERAADRMYLPFDPEHQVHLQDDSFLRKKPWFGALPGVDRSNRPTTVLSEQYHPLTIYRHRVCKQADVLLAQSLLDHCFSLDAKQANFRYYENLTTHDSSLTTSTFSIIASGLGHSAKAFDYFRRAACVDVDNIVGNTREGLHMAAMGGSWSCVVRGFAGLQIHPFESVAAPTPTLYFDPYVPERWKGYSFTLLVRDAVLHVDVTRTVATYKLTAPQSSATGEGSPVSSRRLPNAVVIAHGPDRRLRLTLGGEPQRVPLHRSYTAPVFDTVAFDVASLVAHVEDDHYAAWKAVIDPLIQELGSGGGVGLGEGMHHTATTFGGCSIGTSLPEAPMAMTPITNAPGLSREQYFAYVRYHPIVGNRRFGGLSRLLASMGLGHITYGDPSDGPNQLTVCGLANRKKLAFRDVVRAGGGVRAADGVETLLRELRSQKVNVGCASSSRNARWLLEEAGIGHLIDYIVDGNNTEDADEWREGTLLQRCVGHLGSGAPDRSVVLVDSIAGLSKTALFGSNGKPYGLVCCTNGDGEATDAHTAKQYGVDVLCGALATVSVEDLQRWMMAKSKTGAQGTASETAIVAQPSPGIPVGFGMRRAATGSGTPGNSVPQAHHARVSSNVST
jgi:trehalose/maltose hydrolase-like predicted phosphorylase